MWEPADEPELVGTGVWKTNAIDPPGILTDGRGQIWRIATRSLDGEPSQSSVPRNGFETMALPADATARRAELAARLHEFERRHARQNHQGAVNMVAGLLR